jgi:hypothetical protein
MRILHDARDLLVIHSSARRRKLIASLMMAMGAVLVLVAVGYLVGAFVLGADLEQASAGTIFLGSSGLVIGGIGALNFYFASDKVYHFRGKEMQLLVRLQRGEYAVPFERIAKAVVVDDGGDSIGYALKLKLRDPAEEMDLTQRLRQDDAELKALADRINRFLKFHKDDLEDVSIDLADADLATAAKALWTKLWHGTPAMPAEHEPPAPVVREGEVLFVCPECGFQTGTPGAQPPYECERCHAAGAVVLLQDRTPGRTIVVPCPCGASFAVPLSFAGTKRPCPKCGQKCRVPEASPAARARNKDSSRPTDTSFREGDA